MDKVNKKQIEDVIENLQVLLDTMDEYQVDSISVSPNTYGIHGIFISFPSKGFLELEEEYYDLVEDEVGID